MPQLTEFNRARPLFPTIPCSRRFCTYSLDPEGIREQVNTYVTVHPRQRFWQCDEGYNADDPASNAPCARDEVAEFPLHRPFVMSPELVSSGRPASATSSAESAPHRHVPNAHRASGNSDESITCSSVTPLRFLGMRMMLGFFRCSIPGIPLVRPPSLVRLRKR